MSSGGMPWVSRRDVPEVPEKGKEIFGVNEVGLGPGANANVVVAARRCERP